MSQVFHRCIKIKCTTAHGNYVVIYDNNYSGCSITQKLIRKTKNANFQDEAVTGTDNHYHTIWVFYI